MAEVNYGRRTVYRSPRLVVDFELDRGGIRKIARDAPLRLAVREVATKAKAHAESIAPHRTGAYASRFEINFTRVTVRGLRRIGARLVNTDPAAAKIEWGTSKTPAHLTLTKTLQWLGGRPAAFVHIGGPERRGGPDSASAAARRRRTFKPIRTLEQFRADQAADRARDRRYRERRRRRRGRG